MPNAPDWFVIMTKTSCLAVLLWSAFVPTAVADSFHGNYLAGNEFDHANSLRSFRGPLFGDSRIAAPFTVPPGFAYSLDYIELTVTAGWSEFELFKNHIQLELWQGTNPIPVSEGGTAVQINAAFPDYFNPFGPPPPPGPRLLKFTPSNSPILLQPGLQYWVILNVNNYCCINNIPSGALADWMLNSAGVNGTTEGSPYYTYCSVPGSCQQPNPNLTTTWLAGPVAGAIPAFRVTGTPVPAQPVDPSYSSYTAPSTGGPVTLHLEYVCANPLSNPFTMPVTFTLPASQTPAQVCQLLANNINTCGCPCWGAPGCSLAGSPPGFFPWGFQADCCGSVLRVTNSTLPAGVCAGGGAFVCADHADGLTKYNARKQLEGVSGAIAMEIRGVATGVAGDSGVSNSVDVIRTLRCGPDFPPQVSQARVTLAAGMGAREIIQSLAEALVLQGDRRFVVKGNRITFLPPCEQGGYDIAFQVNDTGISYAFSPPFDYSFFDYVARFTTVPTVSVWWWVVLTLLLLLLIALTIKLGRRRAARAS